MEFSAPQIMPVDMLRQAALGQQMGIQRQMLPYQLAAAQQEQEAKGIELDKLKWALNAVRGGSPFGGQNVGGSSGGIQSGPQGSVAAAPGVPGAPMSATDQPTAPTSNDRIATPTAYQAPGLRGIDPSFGVAYHMLTGVDLYKGLHEQQQDAIERQKLNVAPQVALAKSVITSPNPGSLVINNPGLLNTWRQYAPKMGVDPSDPTQMTPENIRSAATLAHNDLVSTYGGEPLAMPHVMEQLQGPNGQRLSRDPLTGEIKQEVAPESLHSVIGANGQPTLLPSSQATGKQPFSPSIFGANNMSGDAIDFAADYFRQNNALPPGMSRNPAIAAKVLERVAASGNDAASILATKQLNTAAQAVLNDFTSGATNKTLNGLNTAITHMDILEKSADALQNGNIQGLNAVSNLIGKQFGKDPVTNFNIVRDFAAGEVAKAVLPGGGGEAERQRISDEIKASSSPQQFAGALQKWRNLLAGKTEALRNTWDVGSRGAYGSFNRFLLPATKKALGIDPSASNEPTAPGSHPDDIEALLKKHGTK